VVQREGVNAPCKKEEGGAEEARQPARHSVADLAEMSAGGVNAPRQKEEAARRRAVETQRRTSAAGESPTSRALCSVAGST